MEVEASRIRVEADKIDQATGMSFQVNHKLFVGNVKAGKGPGPLPVVHHPLKIGKTPRDILPVIGPGGSFKPGLPAREGDIARGHAPANDNTSRGPEECDEPDQPKVVRHLVHHAAGGSRGQRTELFQIVVALPPLSLTLASVVDRGPEGV